MLAMYQLAPWGEVASDYRMGVLGIGIAKAALGHPVSGEDFAVDFSDKTQTPEQMQNLLRGLAGHKGAGQ